MAKTKDVFGFAEISKSFAKYKKKYDSDGDAMLMATGNRTAARTRQLSPSYHGKAVAKSKKHTKLKRSWKLLKVKEYQNGKFKVVRIQSLAPHAHLIENGHVIYHSPQKYKKKASKYGSTMQKALGITTHGKTKAFLMLHQAMKEYDSRIANETNSMMDKISESEGLT